MEMMNKCLTSRFLIGEMPGMGGRFQMVLQLLFVQRDFSSLNKWNF